MKKQMGWLIFVFAICIGFLAPTCSVPQIDKSTAKALAQDWHGKKIAGKDLLPETNITLRIKGWRVSGTGGCNGYSGEVKRLGLKVVRFGEITSSTKACSSPSGVLQQEKQFLDTLRTVTGYQLSNTSLYLKKDGQIVLTFSSLK